MYPRSFLPSVVWMTLYFVIFYAKISKASKIISLDIRLTLDFLVPATFYLSSVMLVVTAPKKKREASLQSPECLVLCLNQAWGSLIKGYL